MLTVLRAHERVELESRRCSPTSHEPTHERRNAQDGAHRRNERNGRRETYRIPRNARELLLADNRADLAADVPTKELLFLRWRVLNIGFGDHGLGLGHALAP